MEIFAFVVFLAIFMFVGILSSRYHSKNQSAGSKVGQNSDIDYLLAGRDVSPLLTALSAAATKYSGYMFIALMGYIYVYGLSAIWIIFGFLFGDLVAFYFVHAKVREQTEKSNALSFADLISRWHGGDYRILRVVIGLVSLVFLTTYAAAQFSAGGKALQVLFGWHYNVGIIIGAALILSYCLTGGLRASIWTDAAQSVVMLLALLILLVAAISTAGGINTFSENLLAVSPTYMSFGVERFGSVGATALFAFGWLFNGLGVTGQPHVMVRFMALDQTKNMTRTGLYYFSFSTVFLALVMLVGLATRLYLNEGLNQGVNGNFDAELALPMLAKHLLPAAAVGIIMGGIFAAIMSTTDSQILSCSAVLSEDFKLGHGRYAKALMTFGVTLVALFISLFAGASVFTLVVLAWSALASAIGPLLLVHALGRRPAQWLALLMMATGLLTALIWRKSGLSAQVYEALPGILAALAVFALGSLVGAVTTAENKERPLDK